MSYYRKSKIMDDSLLGLKSSKKELKTSYDYDIKDRIASNLPLAAEKSEWLETTIGNLQSCMKYHGYEIADMFYWESLVIHGDRVLLQMDILQAGDLFYHIAFGPNRGCSINTYANLRVEHYEYYHELGLVSNVTQVRNYEKHIGRIKYLLNLYIPKELTAIIIGYLNTNSLAQNEILEEVLNVLYYDILITINQYLGTISIED